LGITIFGGIFSLFASIGLEISGIILLLVGSTGNGRGGMSGTIGALRIS